MSVQELNILSLNLTKEMLENVSSYKKRYPNPGAVDYGNSINDDYNGEGDEYSKADSLLASVGLEIENRFRKKQILCPKCNTGNTFCSCKDVSENNRADGRIDHFDKYELICLACGSREEEVKEGGSSEQSNYYTNCPYCGLSSEIHEEHNLNTVLTVSETIKKGDSDFRAWNQGANIKIIEKSCPKCGFPVVCAYADMGTVDNYDIFNHVCMNIHCDYIEKDQVVTHSYSNGMEYDPNLCTFCSRSVVPV